MAAELGYTSLKGFSMSRCCTLASVLAMSIALYTPVFAQSDVPTNSQAVDSLKTDTTKKNLSKSLQAIDSELAAEEEALLKSLGNKAPAKKQDDIQSARAALNTGSIEPAAIATEPESKKRRVKIVTSSNNIQGVNAKVPGLNTLKTAIQEQQRELGVIQSAKHSLERKVNSSESRIRQLMAQLQETRQELLLAETEVERLSRIIEERNIKSVRKLRSSARVQKAALENHHEPRIAQTKQVIQRTERPKRELPIATVTVPKANLRTGPGLNNSVLLTVGQSSRLVVEKREGDWYRVIAPTGEEHGSHQLL